MSALISVDRLVKQYGSGQGTVAALREVSFEIPEGQFVSVTGPSGCGKSTLLGLLAGLNEPTSGRVVVAGKDVAALSPDARSDLRLGTIGIVFRTIELADGRIVRDVAAPSRPKLHLVSDADPA